MRAGRKENREKSVPPSQIAKPLDQPATAGDKDAGSRDDSPAKFGEPARKTGFAPGTYYRQGVRVPAKPSRSPLTRVRNR